MEVSQTVKHKLSYDPTILLLSIYQKKKHISTQKFAHKYVQQSYSLHPTCGNNPNVCYLPLQWNTAQT